jgi:hypothetical protein
LTEKEKKRVDNYRARGKRKSAAKAPAKAAAPHEKVAIVGFAPSSMMLAPWDDKSFEIWGVNELYQVAPRIDVLFEIHDYELLRSKKRFARHLEWLRNNTTIPVFTQEVFPDIPKSVKFPKDELVEKYGRYFTNSISWEIALAMELGFNEIHLYGVDMATSEEYGDQRPSVEYFVGLARASGIKVYVPPESDLLKCFNLYGFEDKAATEIHLKMKARAAELDQRIQQLQTQGSNINAQLNQMVGAKDDVQYWMRTHSYGDKGVEDMPGYSGKPEQWIQDFEEAVARLKGAV